MSRRGFVAASSAALALATCPFSRSAPRGSIAVLAESRVDMRRGQEWTLEALRSAIAQIRTLAPVPRTVVFLGGLTANGTREELELGADSLLGAGMPVHAVPGPADRVLDDGRAWRERFGRGDVELDLCGTRVFLLDTAFPRRSKGRDRTATRASELGGLASARYGRPRLGAPRAARIARRLAELPPDVPVIIASHASLLPLYAPWNFGTRDADGLLERLGSRRSVTLLTGQARCDLRATWRPGHRLHAVPATSHGQPPPRALCRAVGAARQSVSARPGLIVVRAGAGDGPSVDRHWLDHCDPDRAPTST